MTGEFYNMPQPVPVTLAYGNGIGPEIMTAVLKILEAGGACIAPEEIQIGEELYKKGCLSGIESDSWDSIYRTKVFLKAPITTPQGGGFRSLNVTIRKKLGLYANIRPCVSYHPFVSTKHPVMNVVIIRENEEDLYAGIEYQHSNEVVQCLKIISKSGSRRIARFAFEYAVRNARKKVTCFTKDNIMKKTDGLFRKMFEEAGKDYAEIEKEHWIVDIGAAKLANSPENFDVVVLPNLYGDILSDVAAQISGSIGMAGSANIGNEYAMFEAIHGSAPRRAGMNIANPSGLLQGALLMLDHIGQNEPAVKIQNAWLKTLEDGIHTYDLYQEGVSRQKAGTQEFAQAVIDRLEKKPKTLRNVSIAKKRIRLPPAVLSEKKEHKTLAGADIFIDIPDISAEDLAQKLKPCISGKLTLQFISSRGVSVWPSKSSHVLLSDLWRCRFLADEDVKTAEIQHTDILHLLKSLENQKIDFCKVENLYLFNGKPGFSAE